MLIAHKAHLLVLIILGTVLGVAAQVVVSVDQRGPKQKLLNPEPIVVSVDSKGRFKLGDKPMTLSRLGRALDVAIDERTPPDRVVYITAGPTVPFSQIVKVLKLGRTIEQDSFGLMLHDGGENDPANAVIAKIILEKPSPKDAPPPNPLYLGLGFQNNGKVKLNGEPHTLASATSQLRKIFKDREDNGVYVEGTNEVEKAVFLTPSPTTTFSVIVQTALAVREAGAEPIGIEIDAPRPLIISVISAQP